MVGIVIVSHSARLAQGVLELAREMGGSQVPIAATGGLDLPDQPLGTDAAQVLAAIERVYSPDGVLVLMDLGSALLSTEMAVDMLDAERRQNVVLCAAPLVEGAVAAVVQARQGSPLNQVMAEALHGLAAKSAHLGQSAQVEPSALPSSLSPDIAGAQATRMSFRFTVQNRLGLHARPAARLVQAVAPFRSDVRVTNLSASPGPADARSINGLMTLGIRQHDDIEVAAFGPDARNTLDVIRALAETNFGDVEPETTGSVTRSAVPGSPMPPGATLQGLPGAPGLAIGNAYTLQSAPPTIPDHVAAEPQAEWADLLAAIERARSHIRATKATVERQSNREAAAILDAHLLYLDDDAILSPARRAILDHRLNAAAAWSQAVDALAAWYAQLDDEYLRSRAADIREIGQLVVRLLLDGSAGLRELPILQPGILIAGDLTVAEVAHLDPSQVKGICLAFSAPTAHSIILARAKQIPAVVGLGEGILGVPDATQVIVDGDQGWVNIGPDLSALDDANRRLQAQQRLEADALDAIALPAVTRDGRRVEVAANIASIADVDAALRAGADGVGLLRTEFLFLDRQTAPDEEEQYAAYRAIAQTLAGRPLIIRTLDVGGDKPLPYLDLGTEPNPALGWRAIRVCLDRPDLFKTQLRAIVRTAAEFPAKIMFPMIATRSELRQAKALLMQAQVEVAARSGTALDSIPHVETGIMIEIPAAALQAAQFAADVDFFSIGTNDLTQYTLAAERGNPRVAALSDALQPAVLQLIQQVVSAAHARDKWVGVCGELAGDPLAIPLLVALGVDELSMNAPAIPRAKQVIRARSYSDVSARAPAILELESPDAIREALSRLSEA